jgi:hypothetical protein
LTPLLLDLVLPIGGYFLLHNAFGLSAFWALTISGVATAVPVLITTFRRCKVDALGLLIVLEIALASMLVVITHDPRIILAKPAFFIALGGFYVLATCFVGKPLAYAAGKPIATKGDFDLLVAYEWTWEASARFRSVIRTVTAVWAAALLADAIQRVVVVFSVRQIDRSTLLSQVPSIVLIAGAVLFTRLRMRALRPLIETNLPVRI